MIEAGEEPAFIARRIMICAAEDVSNADPNALVVATSASLAVETQDTCAVHVRSRFPRACKTVRPHTRPGDTAVRRSVFHIHLKMCQTPTRTHLLWQHQPRWPLRGSVCRKYKCRYCIIMVIPGFVIFHNLFLNTFRGNVKRNMNYAVVRGFSSENADFNRIQGISRISRSRLCKK